MITTPRHADDFQRLLGDGGRWGLAFRYAAQPSPDGLAQAFLIGREFIGGDACALVLGDNIFHGDGLTKRLRDSAVPRKGATVFCCRVPDPERYGVVALRRDRPGDLHRGETRPPPFPVGGDGSVPV